MASSIKISSCVFVGSFVAPNQVPSDRRPHIAFAGRSNVGKSSLLNRLVGQKRMAKVSADPGKTRALNFFLINDRFYFVDLPGYGYAKVSKEMRAAWGRLIEGYLSKNRNLIGLVLLVDCRREPTEEDYELVGWLAERGIPTMVAVTKVDKLSRDKANRKVTEIQDAFAAPAIAFSAVSGVGKNELVGAIFSLVNDHMEHTKA